MADCKRAQTWIAESLGGELAKHEQPLLDEHLASCRRCRQVFLADRELLSELRQIQVPELSQADWAGYVPALRQRLQDQTRQMGWLDLFRQPVVAFLGVALLVFTLSLLKQPTLLSSPLQYGSETELEALLELTESLDAVTVELYEPLEYAWETSSDTSDSFDEDMDPFSFLDWDDTLDVDQLDALRATLGS